MLRLMFGAGQDAHVYGLVHEDHVVVGAVFFSPGECLTPIREAGAFDAAAAIAQSPQPANAELCFEPLPE